MRLRVTKNIRKSDKTIRWSKGQILDYPLTTWEQIARSLGVGLHSFTEAVPEVGEIDGGSPS